MNWKENSNGNHVSFNTPDGQACTVFSTDRGWKWVHDGQFSKSFDSYEDAQIDAEEQLN